VNFGNVGLVEAVHLRRPDMEEQVEDPAQEVKRLQRCINDLVSVLALSAIWRGSEASQIVQTLLDVLLRMLDLEFAYARLNDAFDAMPVEIVRVAENSKANLPLPQELRNVLRDSLAAEAQGSLLHIPHRLGVEEISIFPVPLGIQGEIGMIVLGSNRVGFPGKTESLLLSVAASQASIGLQEARLLSEQKRTASELEQRVADRTRALDQTNAELRKEIADRKMTEQKLRQEERELKRSEVHKAAILASSPDAVVAIDHEGRITEFNPAAEQTFGHRREDVLGTLIADVIIPPSLREKHLTGFARYLATGESKILGRHIEMTALRADGNEFPVELTITRIPQDGPPAFTGYIRDITERKRSEDALREAHAQLVRSEERWRSVFESSAVGVALADLNGRFIATNSIFQKILGYTDQELQEFTFIDVTQEEYRDHNAALIRELLGGGRQQFQIEKQCRRKDGTFVWVRNNVSIVPGTERVPRFLMALSEDITQRKLSEEALAKARADLQKALDEIKGSQAYLGKVLDTIPTLTWTMLPDGSNEFLSRKWEEYTGLPVGESHGWAWQPAFHPDDLPALVGKWMDMLAKGEPGELEARLRRFDGVYRWFLIRAEPFRDETGTIVRWYGNSTDIEDRKRAEQALVASERNLAAIINTIPTTAWTTRPDGYCDFLNQGWLDYTGMTAEQAQGWGWTEAIHSEDRTRLVKEWESCLRSGTPIDTEARIRRFGGSYRYFLIRANPLRDESGNILKWYGTCTDIEDQKRGEQNLRARELSWRQIVDNIPGLVATTGALGEVEFLNRQTLEYFGNTSEELKDWALIGAVHPDDLPRVIEERKKSIEIGQIYEVEHRCRRADGVYRWFQVRGLPIRDAENKVTAWYLLLTDIDDRKRAEEALQASELDARSLLDNMPGLLARLSPDGTPEFLNRQFLQYLGKSMEEIGKYKTNDIVHPDDRPRNIEALGKALLEGEPFDFEDRIRRFDGVYRWFQARLVPVRNLEGKILHWNALVTDIEERKRAEEELRVAQSELARVSRVMTMGQLTASIAHEVNQPLSGIITNASTCLRMLDAAPPNLEGARETARRTIRDGHRASDIVTRLRMLYSKKEPALEPMDLNEVAREVASLSSTEIQRNGVTLRQEFADDLPPALGDRVQLQQVILNLLRNAADAMSTIDDRPRELLVTTERDQENHVRLSVKDSGVGITPQAADKIFQAFYTTKSDGMGIGLSISRSIIEAHQGRLWAIRNDGPGSTFSFSIPCRREGLADVEIPVSRANPSTGAA
jgi:PAS domain S-box-containing protein